MKKVIKKTLEFLKPKSGFFKSKNESGIILISILLVAVILLMMGSAMVIMNYHTLGFTAEMESKEQALRTAEAGISYAVYSLMIDPSWGNTPGTLKTGKIPMEKVKGTFEITFDKNDQYFSTNCLDKELYTPPDPNVTWGGAGLPPSSLDLIVTGTVNTANGNVVKRLRVVLQRDANFGSALATGEINSEARRLDISKEVTMQNPSESGTIHSNSVKKSPYYAIYTNQPGFPATKVYLHGGKASSNGDIDIVSANLDTSAGSMIDPVKQSKNITPIDIQQTLDGAKSRLSTTAGQTFVVYKDHISPPLAGTEVIDGKLYIKNDILFSGDVNFEFDYASIKPLGRQAVKDAGVYLQDPNNAGTLPSVYVDNGNLTIAGPIRGNGAVYSSGTTQFIGESNLVGPTDPGVVILSQNDLTMSLPCVSDYPLDLNFTGLVYTHGNANINILDPCSPASPIKNSSSPWPSDWEDMYLKPLSVKDTDIPNMRSDPNDPGTAYGSSIIKSSDDSEEWRFRSSPSDPNSAFGTLTQESDGTYSYDGSKSAATQISIDYAKAVTTTITVGGGGGGWGGGGGSTTTTTSTMTPQFTLTFNVDPNVPLKINPTGVLQDGSHTMLQPNVSNMVTALNTYFNSYVQPSVSANKVEPNFHITGALVAIDPNNPMPSDTNPDSGTNGNINITIIDPNCTDPALQIGSKLFINQSSRYLKLLQSSKAYTGYRWLYWSEI